MVEECYFLQGENSVGPLTRDQLIALHQAGSIGDATLVWCSGDPDWIPLGDHFAFQSCPPPLPLARVRAADNRSHIEDGKAKTAGSSRFVQRGTRRESSIAWNDRCPRP